MKDPVTFYPGNDTGIDESPSTGSTILRSSASRRAFIKGVIASGAVAGSSTFLFGGLGGCTSDQPAAGAVERLVSLNVNGTVRRVDVLPNETLAMTLRYKLGLTGTKLGCDRGECGACTVVIDGVATYACSTLTHMQCSHGRGARERKRRTAPDPAGIHRRARTAMRFLHAGTDHVHGRAAGSKPEPDERGGEARAVGQPLPLRRLRPLPELRHACGTGGLTWHTNFSEKISYRPICAAR
jgi:hypothetical protein